MIKHDIHKLPQGLLYSFASGDGDSLGDMYLEDMEKDGVSEIWYWYSSGSCEGDGEMIFLLNDKFYLHSMEHCSCYGPTSGVEYTTSYDSVESLVDACSDERKLRIADLVDEIKKGGK